MIMYFKMRSCVLVLWIDEEKQYFAQFQNIRSMLFVLHCVQLMKKRHVCLPNNYLNNRKRDDFNFHVILNHNV